MPTRNESERMPKGHQEQSLYLHIGLPKTGTTFLQDEVLPRLRSLHFLCKPRTEVIEGVYPMHGAVRRLFDRSPAVELASHGDF